MTLGDQSILFAASVRGIFQRPFYLAEFLEQCRFILTSCFVPLLLTGLGWGTIVALEAGNFFKLASAEWRIGGFMVLANVREFAPVATGLMVAAVCGTEITAHQGVVACFVSIQIFEYLYTPTVLALFHTNNVLR